MVGFPNDHGVGMGADMIDYDWADGGANDFNANRLAIDAANEHTHQAAFLPAPTQTQEPTPPYDKPSDDFWNALNVMQLPSTGFFVTGAHGQLWADHEELRPAIVAAWRARWGWGATEQVEGSQQQVDGMAGSQAAHEYPAPTIQQQPGPYPQVQGMEGMEGMEGGYATPHSYQQQPAPPPSAAGTRGKSKVNPVAVVVSKRKRAPDPNLPTSVPAYAPDADLDSPAAAREYLSHYDSDEATLLQIAGDDVEAVKATIHFYAAQIYNALLHPYDANAGDLSNRQKQKYIEAQDKALITIRKLLSTTPQLKAAKAAALLAVSAAINLHTTGVSAERMAKHALAFSSNTVIDNAYRISPALVCSARIAAMAAAVARNKCIARDVLEGKNLLRFAECPDAYVERKMQFHRSNATRQEKIDERAEVDRKEGITGRYLRGRKRARVEVEEDGEEDGEWQP